MIPPNFSLFSVVLEIRKQRPMAIQTEVCAGSPHSKDTSLLLLSSLLSDLSPPCPLPQEQYRFLYHTVAQMFLSALQDASRHYQNLKEVPRPPSSPQRPGPRAELHGHHYGSIQPLDSFQ